MRVNRRRVILVRHGEYQSASRSSRGGRLTARGKRQAIHLAKYLSVEPATRVVCSDLTRARQTAHILHRVGGHPKASVSAALREFLPSSIPGRVRLTRADQIAAHRHLHRVVETYFRPGDLEVLLLIGHGNLIRALVCRTLRMRLHQWHRMSLNHCSVTEVQIGPAGERFLVRFNEVGFMPRSMRTA